MQRIKPFPQLGYIVYEQSMVAVIQYRTKKVVRETIKSQVHFFQCKQKGSIKWGSKIKPFEIQKHLNSWLFEHWISNGPVFKGSGYSCSYSYSPNHLKTGPFKNQTTWKHDILVRISNGFWQNGSQLSRFQIVELPDFRSHSKSWSLANQPLFEHFFKLIYSQITDHAR